MFTATLIEEERVVDDRPVEILKGGRRTLWLCTFMNTSVLTSMDRPSFPTKQVVFFGLHPKGSEVLWRDRLNGLSEELSEPFAVEIVRHLSTDVDVRRAAAWRMENSFGRDCDVLGDQGM